MMKLHLLPIFAVLLLAVAVRSHTALPSELYWEKTLPNTPMPKALRDLLQPSDLEEEKSTYVSVGKGGVGVDTKKPGRSGTAVNVGKGGVSVNSGKPGHAGTNFNVGREGVGMNAQGKTNVVVGKVGVGVKTGHKDKPVNVGVGNQFEYTYAATEDQLHDNPQVALFFLEDDLIKPNAKMNLQFTRTTSARSTFLPRQVSEAMPFSSQSLPEILNKLSVEPNSEEARAIQNTIKECEEPAMVGEDKYCATSLESMIDFSTSKLGMNVRVMATQSENSKKQEYTIMTEGLTQLSHSDDESVVCHGQNYAYAVFYCHSTRSTRAYEVPLVGTDGSEAKAVAVCHTDTSSWNPKHWAFQVLKVKPGTVPICHFLPEDHIVWVPKQKFAYGSSFM